MIDVILISALVGLLAAAFLDSGLRPHLLLNANVEPTRERARKMVGYLFARRKTGGPSRRNGTKTSLGDGKWELRAELPKGLDGRRRRTYEVFVGTSREADQRLLEIQNEIDTLEIDDRPETVGELLDRWLTKEVEPTVRESTYHDYKRRVETYVRPLIGQVKLKELTLAKVEEFRNQLIKRPVVTRSSKKRPAGKRKRQSAPRMLSETTVSGALKTLSMCLNYARRHRYLPSNVMHDLKRRPAEIDDTPKGRKRALKASELKAFVAAARGNYWYALFVLMAITGLRPSEALALRWEDLDWDRGWLYVNRKLTLLPGGTYRFDPPKTKSSKRRIPLSPKLRAILQEHLKTQERLQAYDPDLDLVFGDLAGQPADSRNILRRHVKPIAKKAGLGDDVTLYSFRYSFMTLSTNRTGAPKLTSMVLGHKDVTFSQNVYNDPDDEELRESTHQMDEFIEVDELDQGVEGAKAADRAA